MITISVPEVPGTDVEGFVVELPCTDEELTLIKLRGECLDITIDTITHASESLIESGNPDYERMSVDIQTKFVEWITEYCLDSVKIVQHHTNRFLISLKFFHGDLYIYKDCKTWPADAILYEKLYEKFCENNLNDVQVS